MHFAGQKMAGEQIRHMQSLLCVTSAFLCGPLRISAFSALMSYFNAEATEIRRGPQRKSKVGPTQRCLNLPLAVTDEYASSPNLHA